MVLKRGTKTNHQKNVEALKESKQSQPSLFQTYSTWQNENNALGERISEETHTFRLDLTYTLCATNTPINKATTLKPFMNKYTDFQIGASTSLADYFPAIRQYCLDIVKEAIGDSYKEYSVTIDGTPSFAEAEAIKIRLVPRDFRPPVEFVIRIRLLKKSPNHQVLGKIIIQTLLKELSLSLNDLLAVMLDRAAVNHAAIAWMEKTHDLVTFEGKCNSHTLTKCGEKFNDKLGKQARILLTRIFGPNFGNARLASLGSVRR